MVSDRVRLFVSVRLSPVVPYARITQGISWGNTFILRFPFAALKGCGSRTSLFLNKHLNGCQQSTCEQADIHDRSLPERRPVVPTAPHNAIPSPSPCSGLRLMRSRARLSGASQVSRSMRGNGPGFCGSDKPASDGAGRPLSSIHGTSVNRVYVF